MSAVKEWRLRVFDAYQISRKYQYEKKNKAQNNAPSVIMAVLLSIARIIKVSALYLFLPFLFPSSVTREFITVFEYLRNIISRDNTTSLQEIPAAFQRNNLLIEGESRR